MKKMLLSNLLVVVGGLLYAFLFWKEGMGLNTFLYSIFLLGALSIVHPGIWQSRRVIIMGTATVFSAMLVVWHHSLLARFTHIITLLLFIGFVQVRELRFVWYAFLLGITSLFSGPAGYWKNLKFTEVNQSRLRAFWYWFKLILFPVIVGVLFFMLYYQANLHFAGMMDRIGAKLVQLFTWRWAWGEVMLFLLGAAFTMALLWPALTASYFQKKDQRRSLELFRRRAERPFSKKMNALRQEFWRAKLTIGLLNGLLFIVNVTDLRYVWVEYETVSAAALRQYVHEGTYLLIFTILLAMLVLIYFFRRNLNFYPENKGLVDLANLWLLQNAMLVLSVGHRNYQYISHYGLAYKRLAVIFFLLLVLFGLFTLYLKIKHKRTLFYLFLLNGWALYATVLLTSTVNWDVAITRYNIHAKLDDPLDLYFLGYQMSDKNLRVLEAKKEQVIEKSRWTAEDVNSLLNEKRAGLIHRTSHLSWKSWNVIDWRNRKGK